MTINISKLHLEILDEPRATLLNTLVPYVNEYTLGGGTALALQLCHRQSFDFDFFTTKKIPKNLLEKISEIIKIKNVLIDNVDELTILSENDIKLTFLSYPFEMNFPKLLSTNNLSYFSVKSIAIQKAYTIGRRGAYRDYFDLYTILKEEIIHIQDIINKAKDTYGSLFNEKIFFQQLNYFDDILDFTILPVDNKTVATVDEVKKYFEELTKNNI